MNIENLNYFKTYNEIEKHYSLIIENKENLVEVLKNTENVLSKQILQILSGLNENNYTDIFEEENKLLKELLIRMIEQLKEDEGILNSINRVIEIFNGQMANNKKLFIGSNKVFIQLENGDKHPISELSSGEKHLLTFLTLFIIEGSKRDILMIDEPEISLNIKWQRKFLKILSEVAPNTQIIVASHSPSIAESTNNLVKLQSVGGDINARIF